MRKFILLTSFVFLSACGTTGTINADLLNQKIPANKARVIIERDTSLLYLAASADVSLNGRKIASLGRGSRIIQDIPAGKHTLSVNTPTAIGNYTTGFNVKSGKTYNFMVGPNENKSMMPGILLGPIGEAIDAHNNENTGYFQIVPIDKQN